MTTDITLEDLDRLFAVVALADPPVTEEQQAFVDGLVLPRQPVDAERLAWSIESTDEERWDWIAPVFDAVKVPLAAVPEAWKEDPLSAWCWLVLEINGIDHDPEVFAPLDTFGIPVGATPREVRHFAFALA
jgi:hypothetical protein